MNFVTKENFKLKLEKGIVKEDVAYSKLYEDYHPGDGPNDAVENSFLSRVPAFLKRKELKKFDFKKAPAR